MSNPYQAFFDKLDATIPELSRQPEQYAQDAVDLLQRAGFVLGNLINAQSQVYPMLFLPADNPEPDTEDAEGTSLEQPESPAQ